MMCNGFIRADVCSCVQWCVCYFSIAGMRVCTFLLRGRWSSEVVLRLTGLHCVPLCVRAAREEDYNTAHIWGL